MRIVQIFHNNDGDTIIEVLISMIVISIILTGGYVTSNQSLRQIRAAEEKTQALGIAQTQLENLRAQASSPTVFGNGANSFYHAPGLGQFCFTTTGGFQTLPSANCIFTSGDSAINYTVSIQGQGTGQTSTSPSDPISTYTFKIYVSWPSPTASTTTDQLSLYYRVAI